VTADHTPERLSAEEQLAPLTWLDWRILRQAALKWAEQVQHGEPGPEPLLGEVKHILAAHLADVEARLAVTERDLAVQQETTRRVDRLRVEAEARLAATLTEVGIELRRSVIDGSFSLIYPEGFAALHPDPSKLTGDKP
jgi:hypothetical protein